MLTRRNMRARYLLHTFLMLILFALIPPVVQAEESDETLRLLGQQVIVNDPVVGRLPRQISQTPENTTVITAAEIEALNAHTLLDILATVPGVQLEGQSGSANITYTRIQGSNYSHVLVLLDGIPYNNLGDNYSDIGQISARIIERIEIVKGAASSAWGQALGGVVNVITKSASTDRQFGGMASSSLGEMSSRDTGVEISGSVNKFGYYLSAGYLESDGSNPNTGFNAVNGHSRLTYQLPKQGQVSLQADYSRYDRGDFALAAPYDYQSKDNGKRMILGLNVRQPLTSQLELELNGYHSNNQIETDTAILSTNQPLQVIKNDERVTGSSVRILSRQSGNLMVAGIDYQHAQIHSDDAFVNTDILDRKADRWGFYLNDTLGVGPISLSPGVRYDITGTSGNQFSPSFGLTWQLTDTTLLRGYTAKGYSLPGFTLERESEKVWTSQVGMETSAAPYMWLKGTLFRNDTKDITTYDSTTRTFGTERQVKQGFEFEARTTEVYNLSLRSGYCYIDAKRKSDDSEVFDVPRHTVHLGLKYDDHKLLKAFLTGRYIDWNAAPYRNGSYQGMLWDLHLNATPFSGDFIGAEIFFSIRNIFNGNQYQDEFYRSNGRWAEGGVRFRF